MRQAGLVVADVHHALREACAPGVTTAELDAIVADVISHGGAEPNFLNYHGFPGTVCISVNEEIVHGIPGERVLQEGDIVSFDCGAKIRDGKDWWHSDAAITLTVGAADKRLRELNKVTEGSMWAGIAALATGRKLDDVGGAIEDYVEEHSDFGLIEGYTGHGIGRSLHEAPTVYNYRTRGRSEKIRPGMVLCIEPMVVAGDISTRVLADEWTVVSADGEFSAHWEHTVAVLPHGISVLTAPDFGRARLAPYGITPVSTDTL